MYGFPWLGDNAFVDRIGPSLKHAQVHLHLPSEPSAPTLVCGSRFNFETADWLTANARLYPT
jgi:hypothetical protein